ncbi:hypothetical protein ACWDR0_00045 [Streptomyces sp. NPDC003691]
MKSRRRLSSVLLSLALGGALLIGAAAQLAKMSAPDAAAHGHKRISDVAPILIG